ncbi:discoidin domain-containing protein [Lentzea sp. NEAU-D7]|uniref:discoidin domain-containing protein n=1 Tax=Lentzea sp. NEAU-D7 TaxID=2994667 RepID=UPI00224A4CF7|nr:discoidin domain-containing protein [Lentzea sp. NEAU-D7]MCX2947265.1 discoidin domain-containing protein [Lentzea sp. NEAU-D7]
MSPTTRVRSLLAPIAALITAAATLTTAPAAQAAPVSLDLAEQTRIDQVTLTSSRNGTETFAVQTSLDGRGWSTLVAERPHDFRNGKVTFQVDPTLVRHVRATSTTAKLEVREAAVGANLQATYSASSTNQNYGPGNAGDGNQGTYWESANNAFPQWIQADLGAAVKADRVVLKLPTGGWGARTQTLAVQGGTDGQNFTDLVASRGYEFTPSANNTVTIDFTAATTRYVRLRITANTGWPAAQLSEFEVQGPTGGDTQAPSAPGNLALTQPQAGQIRLTWNASTDNTGVTAYDVYANGTLRTTVTGTTYTDSQPDGLRVSYHVIAKDAAGNQSPASNTVTREGATGTNLAQGKPVTANNNVHNFVAANANDGNLATYWESNGFPGTLTVQLGSNADVSSVAVKLNPDSAWGARTQNVEVLGREQNATGFTSLTAGRDYRFDPASGNAVTINAAGRVADVQLRVTSNTGAPGAQVAEVQVFGTPAPNPDLTVTTTSITPASPVETDQITLNATVRNAGSAASAATDVTFFLGTTAVGTAQVGALAAGAQATASTTIAARPSGSYEYTAKVDETKKVAEQNETNNARIHPDPLVVTPVPSSDLVAVPSWSPSNPAGGQTTTFSVAIKNQGTTASAAGAHGVTVTILNSSGQAVRTLTGSHTGTINAGATTAPLTLGTWPAADGRYTVRTVIANDGNEIPAKQGNNTSEQSLFIGRGASVPWQHVEAEDATVGGGAQVLGPNRTIGDLAGEASGRRAVTLNGTGQSVEFTTSGPTNTLVTRFSIPDSSGGGGITSNLNVYVNGQFHKAIDLTSKYIWLYGNEAEPGNSPGAGGPRHIYDEANVMLNSTFPAGTKIKLQKDAANTTNYAIDFVNFEQVTAAANPDAARYAVPAGFTHQDVQNALDRVRMDTTGALVGVYLPAGTYPTAQKFQVYGKAVRVVGAGPWFTRFQAPPTQENTDIGFSAQPSASGSTFSGFAVFGNYTARINGPGKVFDLAGVQNMTIENIWVEHMMCLFWGNNVDNNVIRDSRIRDMYADGLNLTNGSAGNRIANIEARSTGDDAFALFAATDSGGSGQQNNVFENLSVLTPWRAAGLAVYGGKLNTFRNIYVADTLTYSAVTISSLDFGYPMEDFGPEPTTFSGLTLVRSGGHFWGAQTFGAIWMFSASKKYTGIRVSDVEIVDPTYSGIMFQTKYNGAAENVFQDTVLSNVSISGARKSGDAFDAKSGFGLWANEMPEQGQGPAVGEVTFNGLRFSNNFQDIRNTTSTFKIIIN